MWERHIFEFMRACQVFLHNKWRDPWVWYLTCDEMCGVIDDMIISSKIISFKKKSLIMIHNLGYGQTICGGGFVVRLSES